MPIYEYQCESCGAVSEYLVSPGSNEPIRCKQCNGRNLHRVLSAASFARNSAGRAPGRTCCGREERCESPPCSGGGGCGRG